MPLTVISASRRTDIPAFYMPWFMACIDRGYFKVTNPYNRRTTVISATPDRVHTIVLWSKNFGPFLRRKDGEALTRRGYRLFFNFTINSTQPILEPMMPPLEERLGQLSQLVDAFGPQCIHWRFDPICCFKSSDGTRGTNLSEFQIIARRAADLGLGTCITSFVDLYRKVAIRLRRHGQLTFEDPPMDRKVQIATSLFKHLAPLGIRLNLCCEKQVLDALPADMPVDGSACIPNLTLQALHGPGISLARDQSQRAKAGCRCGLSKDVGSYAHHPCPHNCLFCYANPAMDQK
jgi:hypothetical protein